MATSGLKRRATGMILSPRSSSAMTSMSGSGDRSAIRPVRISVISSAMRTCIKAFAFRDFRPCVRLGARLHAARQEAVLSSWAGGRAPQQGNLSGAVDGVMLSPFGANGPDGGKTIAVCAC